MHGFSERAVIFVADARTCREAALVLAAADIPYLIQSHGSRSALVVGESDMARAQDEIKDYLAERAPESESAPPLVESPYGGSWRAAWAGLIAWAIGLALIQGAAVSRLGGHNWFLSGRADSDLMREGEWWRAFTALTLHSNLYHLAGNIGLGGLIGIFTAQMLGPGLAMCTVLAAAGAGNVLNAGLRAGQHISIGASTAVFAALGVAAGFGWRAARPRRESALRALAPLVAAGVLLGMLGTGGVRTDVGAHVWGLVGGIGVSVPVRAVLGNRLPGPTWQAVLFAIGSMVVVGSWVLALRSP